MGHLFQYLFIVAVIALMSGTVVLSLVEPEIDAPVLLPNACIMPVHVHLTYSHATGMRSLSCD